MADAAHNISRDAQYKAFQIAQVKALKTKAESANGEYSSRLGRLEANGLDKKAVKEALKIEKKGQSEVTATLAYFRRLFEYLSYLNLPVDAGQLEMFPSAPQSEPIIDSAFRMGVLAGAMGGGMDQNPHSPETEAGQAWIKGHGEGADNFNQFKAADDEEADEVIPGDEDDDEDQSDIEDELDDEPEDEDTD